MKPFFLSVLFLMTTKLAAAGVCDRPLALRNAILQHFQDRSCETITESELALVAAIASEELIVDPPVETLRGLRGLRSAKLSVWQPTPTSSLFEPIRQLTDLDVRLEYAEDHAGHISFGQMLGSFPDLVTLGIHVTGRSPSMKFGNVLESFPALERLSLNFMELPDPQIIRGDGKRTLEVLELKRPVIHLRSRFPEAGPSGYGFRKLLLTGANLEAAHPRLLDNLTTQRIPLEFRATGPEVIVPDRLLRRLEALGYRCSGSRNRLSCQASTEGPTGSFR